MPVAPQALLVARRELRLLMRSRAALGAVVLLASVAWLPALLLPLRSGTLGIASFSESLPLQIAIEAVILPLLALLAGAELLAGELEDGSLVPALTLPISRRACFAGKCLGRASGLGAVYVVAFTTAGVATAAARGTSGLGDWLAVAGAGLLVSLATGAIGVALGSSARGRVRAFGAALVAWVVLVFALDALLLTLVVALAPPPPGAIGRHGHGEVTAPGRSGAGGGSGQMMDPGGEDPHAREVAADAPRPSSLSRNLMAASPVSLFRLTSLAASSELRPRLGLALPGGSATGLAATLASGWITWLALPLLVGLRIFQRADLS